MSSESTKERILAAATTEFAAFGLAGGRIDRIARAAGANKERIYAYFGSKEQLFAVVVREAVEHSGSWVPEHVEDLPAAVGQLFDLAVREPDIVRLLAWWRLESDRIPLDPEELESYRAKISALRGAQRSGRVDASWHPADLLAIVGALATSWATAPPPLLALADADGPTVVERRAALEQAMRRIIL
ncbi:TetR family transcriptional regulator [Pseudolysinimonas sp.]|jgi:AcrR family transcriptional regulator|uniref:TetR family transcriptional regulator n=1 Tax=Pseudolysinimonas sp. TaxID=2680009 RepID=UPI003783A6DD